MSGNLSSEVLLWGGTVTATPESSILAKGLNFELVPDKTPVDEYIVQTELACSKIPQEQIDELRAEVKGALKPSKPPPQSNITKEEKIALKELRKDSSIMILPADKGRATVKMDSDKYEDQVKAMLSDEKTYEKLDSASMGKYKSKLIGILNRLKEEDKITPQ